MVLWCVVCGVFCFGREARDCLLAFLFTVPGRSVDAICLVSAIELPNVADGASPFSSGGYDSHE